MFTPSSLAQYTGTENYYRFPLTPGIVYTDGVHALQDGAAWTVTDTLIVCAMEKKVAREEFVAVTYKVKDGKALATYTDGNDKVLFKQEYDSTDLPCDLLFFRENGVLMLASER